MIADQIEELMVQNEKSPLSDYEQKLVLFIQQRDKISKNIDRMMSYQAHEKIILIMTKNKN